MQSGSLTRFRDRPLAGIARAPGISAVLSRAGHFRTNPGSVLPHCDMGIEFKEEVLNHCEFGPRREPDRGASASATPDGLAGLPLGETDFIETLQI